MRALGDVEFFANQLNIRAPAVAVEQLQGHLQFDNDKIDSEQLMFVSHGVPLKDVEAALIRRAEIEGAHAVVVNKGDPRAGAVIVKAYDTSTRSARLYAEAFGPDGERLWIQPVTSDSEAELDAYIARQRGYAAMVAALEAAGVRARLLTVPPGEASKSFGAPGSVAMAVLESAMGSAEVAAGRGVGQLRPRRHDRRR